MSTILEAMRVRDGAALAGPGEPVAWPRARTWVRRAWMVGTVVGLTGAAVAFAVLDRTAPPTPPPAVADPPPAIAEPVGPPPPPPAPRVEEPPRARVARWRPGGLPASLPPPSGPVPAGAMQPVEPTAAVAPPPASAQPPAPDGASPAGPSVRLDAIRYAAGADERSVRLAIDAAPPVSLRQGESANGVEVQLILPEAVYVRRGADVFALGNVR